MISNDSFEVTLSHNYLNKNDILEGVKEIKLEILEPPYRKWYKVLFQCLSFNYYKAPYQYKVRNLNI